MKVSLTVILPGRVSMSEQECSKNPNDSYNAHTMYVQDEKKQKELIKFYTKKYKTIQQSLEISDIAYQFMTRALNCPNSIKLSVWNNMSIKQRLEYHLEDIVKGLRGISYTYKVF